MIYLYLFALVVGGMLLGASMLLGGHADGEVHAGGGGAEPVGHDGPHAGPESFFYAVLSLRFWTFFLAFFGLTGFLFEGLGLVPWSWLSATIAVVMGLAAGTGAMWIIRKVQKDTTNSAVSSTDYIGKMARVMVGFGKGEVGKVRLELKGSTIDLLAMPIDDRTFSIKDEVLIVEMDGMHAKVAAIRPSNPA
jgi:membrane protein implicated in regulation of membrane protease activity